MPEKKNYFLFINFFFNKEVKLLIYQKIMLKLKQIAPLEQYYKYNQISHLFIHDL